MEFKDKFGNCYTISSVEQDDLYFDIIARKINSVWEHVSPEIAQNFITTKYSPDQLPATFIVKNNEDIVAFCGLLRSDSTVRSDIFPWFGNCYVYPKFRRHGIMSFMQNYICEYAKKLGFKRIYLWTDYKKRFTNVGWKYLEKIYVNPIKQSHLLYKDLK